MSLVPAVEVCPHIKDLVGLPMRRVDGHNVVGILVVLLNAGFP